MTEIKFRTIKVRRLSELVEEAISDLILSGQLTFGSRMPTEEQISKQFGVSIVTVREALRGLEAFGMIERRRGRKGGTYIVEPKADVPKSAMHYFLISRNISPEHLSQVRAILEPATVALAVKNINKSELKKLEDNVNDCKKRINTKRDKYSPRNFFDVEDRHTEFHRLIAEATHNPLLILITDYMLDFLSSFEKANLVPDIEYSITTLQNHEKILEDFKSQNVEALLQHVDQCIEFIGDYLASHKKKG
jgi:GntR family transcriptional repressor for pyruvate dehydrogenase complex